MHLGVKVFNGAYPEIEKNIAEWLEEMGASAIEIDHVAQSQSSPNNIQGGSFLNITFVYKLAA